MADGGDDVEDAIGVNCVGIVAVDNGRAVVGAGDRQAVEDVQVPSRCIFLKRPGACERV